MNEKTIRICSDFTDAPGARYRSDGPRSGEEFRQEHLEPLFSGRGPAPRVRVILDGAYGYATSFLEEAFGGLARIIGPGQFREHVEIISEDDPDLKGEIEAYIAAVAKENGGNGART